MSTGTKKSLEVVVEPDLVTEDRIIEVEVVRGEATAGDEDDSSPLADLGWGNGGNSSSSGGFH